MKKNRDVKQFYIPFVHVCLPLILGGCTFSIILTDTHGVAEDVVDSTPTTEATTETDLSLPAL